MDSLMARLLEEVRGRESTSVKKVKEDKGVKEMDISIEEERKVGENSEIEKTQLGDDNVSSEEAKTAERGLLVHGLKGRKPKLSEEKREEILTEDTIR